jgi:hypothetical protein
MRSIKLMKKIDSILFKKIDDLLLMSEFQKITDSYSQLEEKYQDIIKLLMGISLIFIPLAIIGAFSLINDSLQEELQLKEEIIVNANEIIQKESSLKREQKMILGNSTIETQSKLRQKVSNQLSRLGIDISKINVSNFESLDLNANIIQAQMDVKFDGLTNDQLFSALANLVQKEKMRIDSFSVKKNSDSNLLDGIFTVYYFSKLKEETE